MSDAGSELRNRQGERLGAYRLDQFLGRGGMGEVWKGTKVDLAPNEPASAAGPFAIKIPLEEALARALRREDALLRKLEHPAIVKEIELVREHDPPFLVMELAFGESARAMLRSRGALPAEIAIVIFSQVLDAMEHAHGRGIVHRDLKPENVIVEPRSLKVKVTDFGLGTANEEALSLVLSRSVLSLGADAVSGTLEYMPPEQRKGGARADPTLDVYALGVLLYELLTGDIPLGAFRLPTEVDRTLPTTLDRVVERALAPKPEHRFAHAGELSRTLRQGLAREGYRLDAREKKTGARETPREPQPSPPSREDPPQTRKEPAPRPAPPEAGRQAPEPRESPAPVPKAAPRVVVQETRRRRKREDLPVLPVFDWVANGAAALGPAPELRARFATLAASATSQPEVALFLEHATVHPGEDVDATIAIRWPLRHAIRSVRFRARTFVRAHDRTTHRFELDSRLAGERPRGLLRDTEAVLVGDKQPLSLSQRLSDAIRTFSGVENALAPGEHEVKLSLSLPGTTPPTFEGTLFSVSHLLVARLDIPLGFDVDATSEVTVKPRGELRALRSIVSRGERTPWISLAGESSGKLELAFGYDEPESAAPIGQARISLVREEELVRGGRSLARRTVLARGVVASHAPVRANRVRIEAGPGDVDSFDVPLPGDEGGLARVRTFVEVRLYDRLEQHSGGVALELGWE